MSISSEEYNASAVLGELVDQQLGLTPETDQAPETRAEKRRFRKLLLGAILPMALNAAVFGVTGLYAAVQVQQIDPASKEIGLALVTTGGAIVTMICTVIGGILSDRTRSRWGRRLPWMLAGGIVGCLGLVTMGLSTSIAMLAAGVAIQSLGLSFLSINLNSIMPDRVRVRVRGLFSSMTGLAVMIGGVGGSIVAAALVGHMVWVYVALGVLIPLSVLVLGLTSPDRSNRGEEVEPFNLRHFTTTFFVSPKKYMDFYWVLIGRFLIYLGYYIMGAYTLYILQDWAGLKSKAVSVTPLISIITLVCAVLATAVSGPISDRIKRRRVFVFISSAIVASAAVVYWLMPDLTGAMLSAALLGLGFGAFQAVDTALVSQVLPSEAEFGKDLGVMSLAGSLPAVIAPAIAGVLVVAAGQQYWVVFPACILLVAVSAFSVFFVKSVR